MHLKVKELIELLRAYNPEDLVVLASDEEGNNLNTLRKLSQHMYHVSEYEEIIDSESEILEEVNAAAVSCTVLWP